MTGNQRKCKKMEYPRKKIAEMSRTWTELGICWEIEWDDRKWIEVEWNEGDKMVWDDIKGKALK